MAVLTQPKFFSQERLDLEDINTLLTGLTTDAQAFTKQFWAPTQFILKGFNVSGVGGPSPATISMTNATLVNPNNSGGFSWFTADTGASPLTVALNSGVRNYIELQLSYQDGTPLARAFWDPSAAGGEGEEFNQSVNTLSSIKIQAVARTGGWSGSSDTIPLAIIDTDGSNNIKLILDRRPLLFRLINSYAGTSAFSWGSQTEPETAVNYTGLTGTFVVGETITFSGGATATCTSVGSGTIGVIGFSNENFAVGNTITGGTSGATATVSTVTQAFTGADKDITNLRDVLTALMTEIRRVKGSNFWFEAGVGSMAGLQNQMDSVLVQSTTSTKASWSWDGTNLALTDSSVSPAATDTIAVLRVLGTTIAANLRRQDAQASTTKIAIPDGSVLFIKLPASGSANYSGVGTGATNFQVVTRASFVPSDQNYWIAYREGAMCYVRNQGQLETGESGAIGDPISTQLLANLGLADEHTAAAYSSNIRGTSSESLVSRIGINTDAIGDAQEDRSAYFRSDSQIVWSGTAISFTTDIVLEIINTKSGSVTQHTIQAAASPLSLANGESLYIAINRAPGGNSEIVTAINSGSTPIPAQSQANKDIFVFARRVDANGSGYLHIPLHKQVLQPGQSVRLGASGSGSGTGSGVGDDLNALTYKASFTELLSDQPTSSNSSIDAGAGKTQSSLYVPASQQFRLAYDATLTVTGTGTSMTMSGSPGFFVRSGDILIVGNEARRISIVPQQFQYTIEAPFSTNPTGAACTVSQAVYTKDLNNFAADGVAISSIFTTAITSALVTYNATTTAGDTLYSYASPPVMAYTASMDGSNYSTVQIREPNPVNTAPMVSAPVSGTNLYLRFFANKTSGTGFVNLCGYKVFFHRDTAVEGGGLQAQAYGMTNLSGAQVNCTISTVNGKTRITFSNFTYVVGLNSGTANGQLVVHLDGNKIPRYVNSTTTPDASYTEVSANTIDLDRDYSSISLSVDVTIQTSVVDSNSQNTTAISALQALPMTPQGRLTLSSTVPVMTTDAVAQTSVYYLPYVGNVVPVYNGSSFAAQSLGASGLTMALNTSNQLNGNVYDLFAFLNAGVLTIAAGPAWSSTTSRGTGAGTTQIQQLNGLWVNSQIITLKNGSTSYNNIAANQATYLGSIYMTANGQTSMMFKPTAAVGGTANVLGVYNAYNRVRTNSVSRDSATYTYAVTSTWRNANGSTNNRVTFLDGLQQSRVHGTCGAELTNSTSGAVQAIGVALDSSTPSGSAAQQPAVANHKLSVCHVDEFNPSLGLHYLQATEWTNTATATFNPSGLGTQFLTCALEM